MMSGFEEIASFRACSGSIPFADEDASTTQSSLVNSNDDFKYKDKISQRAGSLVKSSTESSVPSTRYLDSLAKSTLKKSRTAGCVPLGSRLQRYEKAVLKYQKNGHGSSSDESVARNKSTNSIDAQSVNNILDQYEDLDYGRSSDLSDVGSIDVNNFEATMNLQRQRLKKTLMKPAEVSSNPGNTDVEIMLRKGEVQKRVDEWLSQTQNQSFKKSQEQGLVRSNSSSCNRLRKTKSDKEDTLNVALSCDQLDNEVLEKVSVGVNTSRGPYKEYLAAKSRAKQEQKIDRPRPRPLAIPQRRSSLRRTEPPPVASELVTTVEHQPAIPNKDRESRRPLTEEPGSNGTSDVIVTLGREEDAKRDDICPAKPPGPPVPRKSHRIPNRVSSFKPNNAMYATLQGDEEAFATSLGSESVTRSHYATPKQIEKIYERPRVHVDDLDAILKPGVSRVSAYGDRPKEKCSGIAGIFGQDEDIYAQVVESRCNELLETIMEDQRPLRPECGLGKREKTVNGNSTIYASPRTLDGTRFSEGMKNTFTTFRAVPVRDQNVLRTTETNRDPGGQVDKEKNVNANSLYETRKMEETVLANGPKIIAEETAAPVVSAVLVKTLRFEPVVPTTVLPRLEHLVGTDPGFTPMIFNKRDVLSNDYSERMDEEKLYVTKEEMEHEKLMDLLRKGDFEAAKSVSRKLFTSKVAQKHWTILNRE